MSRLTGEEREILEAFEKGKLKRSKKAEDIQKRHQEYAEAMFRKDARINIRLSSKDLRGLQKRALVRNWAKIVGPQLAEHTKVATVHGQKLVVLVDESKWINALQQMKELLNEKVAEFFKVEQPINIEFRLVSSFLNQEKNTTSRRYQ